jgi:predicted DNA-binding transcriptional regulator AlpA
MGAAMSNLLRTAEMSDQTGIPVATLRWWRHRGEGPRSFKLGKTVFYDAEDVAAWVDSEKAKTVKGGVL